MLDMEFAEAGRPSFHHEGAMPVSPKRMRLISKAIFSKSPSRLCVST